jgi:hypothetical protein
MSETNACWSSDGQILMCNEFKQSEEKKIIFQVYPQIGPTYFHEGFSATPLSLKEGGVVVA